MGRPGALFLSQARLTPQAVLLLLDLGEGGTASGFPEEVTFDLVWKDTRLGCEGPAYEKA